MLWMFLSCVLGYQEDGALTTISIEQTQAAHHYKFDKALKSSLRIVTVNEDFETTGHGSGNYFKIGKHKFVLTAAHLVGDDELYIDDVNFYIKLKPVFIDKISDVAIFIPDEHPEGSKAIEYRINKKKNIAGLTVVHAGYPAALRKSIFNGLIATCSENSFIMQSFALPGSSGSVVFDNSGKVVGVLSAVKMGYSGMSPFPEMYPTLVYVARTHTYDRAWLKERLVEWKSSK